MPRAARKESSTGVYHIMLRGINQQQIFEDDEDYDKFLEVLGDCKIVSGFKLYAYCLMGNHVHLLVRVVDENLETIFKRIGVSYVYWYNLKYSRTGHLFQDRFKSEPIESNEYFFTVIRYIHQNPTKAQLVDSIEAYRWSSYRDYAGDRPSALTDTASVLKSMPLGEFVAFNQEANDDTCLEESQVHKLNDNDAKEIIKRITNCGTAAEFQKLDNQTRMLYLGKLKDEGLSHRQISRLTGTSKGSVQRA